MQKSTNLKRYGIEIHTSKPIGNDLTLDDLQKHGADAIFLAIGAWKGLQLRRYPARRLPGGLLTPLLYFARGTLPGN